MDKEKLEKIKELNNIILNSNSIEKAINVGADLVKDLIEVDRVSIFLYKEDIGHLYTYRADDLEELVFPITKGIAGYVARNKEKKVVNDTSKEPLFYKEIDEESGYHTKNILALPLINSENKLIGVIEFINKLNGEFNNKDITIAELFSRYLSDTLDYMLKNKEYD